MVFTIKIEQLTIFNIIFDISASKYVSLRNLKEIQRLGFLEIYPFIQKYDELHVLISVECMNLFSSMLSR